MKKRMTMPALLAAALLAVTGCSTSVMTMQPPVPGQTSTTGRTVVMNLKAENRGLYLFNCIPLISGNPWRPNREDYYVFQDRLEEKYMDAMLRCRAERLKADDVEDMKIEEHSTGFFSLWTVWRRSMTATAVAVEKKK